MLGCLPPRVLQRVYLRMLAPLPIQIGPPTQYALSRRHHLLAVLILQTVVCILRVVATLDVLGGFIMAVTIGIGLYGWKDDMNVTFIIYWGMLNFINGVFDIIRLIDLSVNHTDVPLWSKDLPMPIRLANLVLVLVPISELLGVPLACNLYTDYMDSVVVVEPIGAGAGFGMPTNDGGGRRPGGLAQNYGMPQGEGQRLQGDGPEPQGGGTFPRSSSISGSSFRAFEGQGHRLAPP